MALLATLERDEVLVLPATNAAWPDQVACSPSGNKLAVVTTNLTGNGYNGFPQKATVINVDGSGAIDVTAETGFQVAVWGP